MTDTSYSEQTRPRNRATASLALVPIAVAAAASLMLAWREHGSFDAAAWLPYAAAIALVLAVVLAADGASRPSQAAAIGVLAFLALAAWTAVSVSWSAVPDLARDEALLVVLYAVALALGAVTVRGRGERLAAVAVIVAALTIMSVATAVKLALTDRPGDLYNFGRLYFPIDYVNAQAALFLIGFWPAMSLACRRGLSTFVRALAVGGGSAMLSGWVLTQSKGGGLALLVSAVVVFAVSAARLRLLVPTLIAATATAAAVQPLTEPFRANQRGDLGAAIHSAGWTTLVVAGAAALLGFTYALIDRRAEISARGRRIAGAIALASILVGIVAGVATFFAVVDRPGHFFSEKWHSFKVLPRSETTSSHLLTLGSNRYDFWRVAADEFATHPLAGIGGRGFGAAYLREGRSSETPQRSHSFELDALAETGLVGFALLAAGVLVPLATIARRARRSLVAAGVLGAWTYWLAHASVDWTWTFPAATLPAVLLLGVGLAREGPAGTFPRAVPAAIVAAALAFFAFVPPWLSARLTQQALRAPGSATADLRWARRLDPLSTEPLLTKATLEGTPADIRPLREAVERQPRRPELHYRLGLAYLEAGRRGAARRELREALRLDPRDDLLRRALGRARP